MDIFWITFLAPWYFLLILPSLFFVYFLYKTKKFWIKFHEFEDLRQIYSTKKFNSFYLELFIVFLILFNFIIILANPAQEFQKERINKNGIDMILAFDVSYSMLAEDLKPNRLEVAKDVIINFIDQIESDRLGLILFSGKPFTSIPLTFDYQILEWAVEDIEIGIINQDNRNLQGTAIWDAVVLASDSFKDSWERERVIIMMTDGEANRWLEPIEATRLSKEENIKIYTVGIWWLENTYVDITDSFGGKERVMIWWIDEDTLQKMAELTWGKYFRATDKASFQKIFDEISKLEKKEIEIEKTSSYKERYSIFLYSLIFLIFLFVWLRLFYYIKK